MLNRRHIRTVVIQSVYSNSHELIQKKEVEKQSQIQYNNCMEEDKAAQYTAEYMVGEYQRQYNNIKNRFRTHLKEIKEAANIEGATQLTTSVMVNAKIDAAIKDLDD